MEGKRRMYYGDGLGEIKKGPWKAEEDRVLINHVKKYGPRDWSSIRSKGLLRRTGKSCRLRWVNKLRPDLKTGVKFSTEEERTVIDLQAQFGNKWAKIATYLPGRTDNDVKNFWSSRQKRLARILQTSAQSSSSSSSHNKTKRALLDVPPLEAPPKFSSLPEEESKTTKSQSGSNSSIHIDDTMYPNSHSQEQNHLQPVYAKKPFFEPQSHLSFPQIPQLQPDFLLPLEGQDFITSLQDPSFLDEFDDSSRSIVPLFSGPDRCCEIGGAVDLDGFMDDFPPIDLFDHIDPLPSPSEWSS